MELRLDFRTDTGGGSILHHFVFKRGCDPEVLKLSSQKKKKKTSVNYQRRGTVFEVAKYYIDSLDSSLETS